MSSARVGWRLLAVGVIVGGAGTLVLTRPVRLGLDLRGGTQIVLEARPTADQQLTSDTLNRTVEVLRRRVDALGVAEPTLQRAGDRRVVVELPGVSDPQAAVEVIGKTAQLSFHRVLGAGSPAPSPDPATPGAVRLPDEDGVELDLSAAVMTGQVVKDAQATIQQDVVGSWVVQIEFRDSGSRQWAELTGEAACHPVGDPQRRIAIVLDREVISSPAVGDDVQCDRGITGGPTVVTGDFTDDEAKDLALLIRAGALPVPVEIVEQRTVGPTLGAAAIRASLVAGLAGAALTILYMIAYYRLLGVLAALALGMYALTSFATLVALGATLTLPGLAGFVLAIGMAVDANVLIFERIKEEKETAPRLRTAVERGFRNAWSAIADSNATTVLAAVLLFFLAGGAVRGFGVTLVVGVLVSMFTAIVATRLLVDLVLRVPALASRPRLLGLTTGARLRRRLTERPPDLMRRTRLWLALSAAAVVVALAGPLVRGVTFGVEFTGGRLVEYATDRTPDLDDVRRELAAAGFPRAIVNESGDGNVSVRTSTLSEADERKVASAVSAAAGRADEVRDEFIGPSIGNELRRKALIALGIALAAQLAYLAVRFTWSYAAGAVAAMFHDLLILVGVFAWLGKTFDGIFLASLLTVIGYSINDSVVVFDRIREQRALRRKDPLSVIANDACLQTLPRTINTGLGALFILVTLYLFGGETLADFALALLIGILVGTYSSVFTATPITVLLEQRRPSPPGRERPPPRNETAARGRGPSATRDRR